MPPWLRTASLAEAHTVERSQLVKACEDLTRQYKAADFTHGAMATKAHRAAYMLVRFPATYAANRHVFGEVRRLAPHLDLASILDLGSGPGTAVYAAADALPSLAQATMIESDDSLLELGMRIAGQGPESSQFLRTARWRKADLRSNFHSEQHDLVVISYALGELSGAECKEVIRRMWACTRQVAVIIEPGTRRGFGMVHQARQMLLELGAHLLAPCPHEGVCPMAANDDWCHFSQRLERTSEHRGLKGGTLGHEDEKFSFLVASRNKLSPAPARIVRHPQKHSGHVQLALCTPAGLQNKTVTKSQKGAYKEARKAEWGDPWQTQE